MSAAPTCVGTAPPPYAGAPDSAVAAVTAACAAASVASGLKPFKAKEQTEPEDLDDWASGKGKRLTPAKGEECANTYRVPLGCVTVDFHLLPITNALSLEAKPINLESAMEMRNALATQRVPPGAFTPGGVKARKVVYMTHMALRERARAGDASKHVLAAATEDESAAAALHPWAERALAATVHDRQGEMSMLLALPQAEQHPDGANVRNWQGRPVLSLACAMGHAPIVRLLLRHGAQPSASDPQGFTPLHESCHEGYGTISEMLLEAGADPAGGTAWREIDARALERPQMAMSPLGIACKRGATLCAQAVLRADPTQAACLDREGTPPFFTAALHRNVECCDHLLTLGRVRAPAPGPPGSGSSPALQPLQPLTVPLGLGCAHPESGLTPAHNAAYNNARGMLDWLIERGAPLEERVCTGQTPLMLAAEAGAGEAVAALVTAGVDIEVRKPPQGVSAFHLACTGGTPAHADVCAYLVSKGAKGVCSEGGRSCLKCKLLMKQARRRLARQADARRRKEMAAWEARAREEEKDLAMQELEKTCPSLFQSFADFANELRDAEREEEQQKQTDAEAPAAVASAAKAKPSGGGSKKKGKKKKKNKGKR